jgi:hypothetical protein
MSGCVIVVVALQVNPRMEALSGEAAETIYTLAMRDPKISWTSKFDDGVISGASCCCITTKQADWYVFLKPVLSLSLKISMEIPYHIEHDK